MPETDARTATIPAVSPPILEMRDISKEFPGVRALSQVNLTVHAGEIHAICGENGAGKSTLMKVLSGVHPYGTYTGDILLRGEEMRFRDIRASEEAGIAIIHQELATRGSTAGMPSAYGSHCWVGCGRYSSSTPTSENDSTERR